MTGTTTKEHVKNQSSNNNADANATASTTVDIYDLFARRGFLFPGSEMYGGLSGFYDYGPLGAGLRRKLVELWRQECVRNEGYVEIDGSNVLREEVLEASGHVANFGDPITRCKECDEVFRADHLINQEGGGINVEGLPNDEMTRIISEKKIKCSSCGGLLLPVETFPLMFGLSVGARNPVKAYLRPETAQNIFTSFQRVFKAERERMPLGIAQTGRSFRNEISPRQGIIRLREFTQMEIEIFLSPDDLNKHPRWNELSETQVRLLTRDEQKSGKSESEFKELECTASEALASGVIPSQYMAYWIAKETLFYLKIGIPFDKFRFRHLLEDETPFYSTGNFDLEVMTEFGWKETIGNAYRTDHDLSSHAKRSGSKIEVLKDGQKFTPHVFEPSWGLDRMFYCVMEYAYVPKDTDREWAWLRLSPKIAPVTVKVSPLMKRDGLDTIAGTILAELMRAGFDCVHDDSGNVGKRYARADEVGIPYCITVDYQSKEDGTVTIRNRDTMKQVRVKMDHLKETLTDLVEGTKRFEDLGPPIN